MYRLVLVNLSADARTVAAFSQRELSPATPAALRELLAGFCAIDPIENSSADTEIRVLVRGENYLLRSAQQKIVLYDVRQRDLPGQILTLDEAIAELDGSAAEARNRPILQMRADAGSATADPVPGAPVAARSKVVPLFVTILLLLAADFQLGSRPPAAHPEDFVKLDATEDRSLQSSLTGVYLTGNDPGQHGIVVTGPGELKLFELAAVEAPHVVYGTFSPGRSGSRLFLATDQPGGLIEIRKEGTLVYCGENYRRIQ